MRIPPPDTDKGKGQKAKGKTVESDDKKTEPLLDVGTDQVPKEGNEKRVKLLDQRRPVTAPTGPTCKFFADRIEFLPAERDVTPGEDDDKL